MANGLSPTPRRTAPPPHHITTPPPHSTPHHLNIPTTPPAFPSVFASPDTAEPVLWSSINAMLERIAKDPELLPAPFSLDMLVRECKTAREALNKCAGCQQLVLGHGDFKPSNVMLEDANGAITFIDFELAGPNYRGFDIFKLFRRGQTSNSEPTPMSHANLRAFVEAYLDYEEPKAGISPGGVDKLEALLEEVYLFEPLTWLEAAVFFLFAITEDPEHADDWAALARHRWEQYELTRDALSPNSRLSKKLGAVEA